MEGGLQTGLPKKVRAGKHCLSLILLFEKRWHGRGHGFESRMLHGLWEPGKLEKSMLSGLLHAIKTDAFWTPFRVPRWVTVGYQWVTDHFHGLRVWHAALPKHLFFLENNSVRWS